MWRPLRLAALVGITVTGIVYSTVLAAIHQPNGAAEVTVNTIVHYVVPVLMVAGWLLFGPRPRIDRRAIGWSLLFPVLWLAYTLIRGAIWAWYPYPFVDVTAHGYARVRAGRGERAAGHRRPGRRGGVVRARRRQVAGRAASALSR